MEQTQEIFFFKISEDRVSGARAVREEGESREGGLRATVECFQVPAHRRDRVFKNTFPLRLAPGDGPERRGVWACFGPETEVAGGTYTYRPAYPDPPPVIPLPESLAAQAALCKAPLVTVYYVTLFLHEDIPQWTLTVSLCLSSAVTVLSSLGFSPSLYHSVRCTPTHSSKLAPPPPPCHTL